MFHEPVFNRCSAYSFEYNAMSVKKNFAVTFVQQIDKAIKKK